MKKYLIFAILVITVVAGVFLSCNREPEMPTEVTMQNVLNVVMRYYPYEEGDVLTFKNENTGETLSLAAKSSENMPFLSTDVGDMTYKPSEDAETNTWGWKIEVASFFTVDGLDVPNNKSSVMTVIMADTERQRMQNNWNCGIQLNGNEFYRCDRLSQCQPKDVYTYLTDTISLIVRDVTTVKGITRLPEDGYLYIVRDKGITEFCLDGKTIWKRVK